MSRKDFIAIAETILNLDLVFDVQTMAIQRAMIAEQFADMLEETNPQFKRDLFIQAATGIAPVTARKARV